MLYLVSLLAAAWLVAFPIASCARISSKLDMDNGLEPRAPASKHRKLPIRSVKILTSPAQVPLTPGERLQLQCEVIGSPGPTVNWLKNGESYVDYEEEANEVLAIHPSSIIHVLSKLVITDAAEGDVFTCVATGIKQDSVSYTIVADDVGTSDNFLEKLLTPPKPVITFFYTGVFQDQGTTIILPCRVAGVAELYWYDQADNVLYDNSRMRVLPSGDLLIQDLKWTDMGKYTCVASNEFGKDTMSTFLYPVTKTVKNITA